jgi:ribosomal protein L11 methyltransferase
MTDDTVARNEPRSAFVLLDVTVDAADEASAALFELGASGVEERDEQTLERGPGVGMVTVVGSFADRDAAEDASRALDPALSPRVVELVGDAWRDAWKQYFVPFRLTDRITIRPPWEAHQPSDAREIVLELEPGRAFGTGLHATTALVARALDSRAAELAAARVLDVGTGSGILAMVAVALGAANARAIDIDPEAIDVARENIGRNGMLGEIEADTTDIASLADVYDVVTANIEAGPIKAMSAHLAARVRPRGSLVLSGVLEHQASEVEAAFGDFALEERLDQGEWVALVLRRRPESTRT